MENIDFNAYVADTISLVRTMVVKCEAIATIDNSLLTSAGYPVSDDKRTWRYYLNLNGQYHAADVKMYVSSLDTGEEILFSKESLEEHLITKKAYLSSGYWYNRLVTDYPAQRELINGILDPIALDDAIGAKNYKILRYNEDLVLWNEDQVIPRLQDWIDAFCHQHFGTEYFYTDNLMLPVVLATLYGLMPGALMTIREEAIGTRYVHDFHIWGRLNSYGDFTQYKNVLNGVQTLWLYRNIEWLADNAGKNYTLGLLIQNLLTVRGIPIAEFEVTYNTENQIEDLSPTVAFIKNNLNLLDRYTDKHKIYTAEEIIDKESLLAKDNPAQQEIYLDDIKAKGKFALFSSIPSKLLESEMEDYTTRHAITLMNSAYHHWVYLVKNGYYNAVIDVPNPKEATTFRLTVKEGLILWTYLTRRIRGEDLSLMEGVFYQNVLKITPPTYSELREKGSNSFLYDYQIKDTIELHVPYEKIISTDAFYQKAKENYLLAWKYQKFYAQYHDQFRQAVVKNVTDSFFERGKWDIKSEVTSFDTWLANKELDFSNYTDDELLGLAWDTFSLATGWDSSNVTLRTLQSSLIKLMLELSSYTIHVYTTIDDGNNTIEAGSRIDLGIRKDSFTSTMDSRAVLLPAMLHVVPNIDMKGKTTSIVDFNTYGGVDTGSVGEATLPLDPELVENTTRKSSSYGLLPMFFTLTNSE